MPEKPSDRMPWYLLRTDDGSYSLSASLVLWSFVASLLMLAAEYTLTALKLPHPPAEPLISTVLLPTIANYFGRRWTDSKVEAKAIETEAVLAQAKAANHGEE